MYVEPLFHIPFEPSRPSTTIRTRQSKQSILTKQSTKEAELQISFNIPVQQSEAIECKELIYDTDIELCKFYEKIEKLISGNTLWKPIESSQTSTLVELQYNHLLNIKNLNFLLGNSLEKHLQKVNDKIEKVKLKMRNILTRHFGSNILIEVKNKEI